MIKIVPFNKKYKKQFYDFNIAWLEKYFYVEPFDREVLSKPEKYIIEPGGHIFFAIDNEEIVGTVALLKRDDLAFELTKMAVPPQYQGKKIGQLLLQHCITFAKENHFKTLYLYSNRKLENAIFIYRKHGFIEIDVEEDSPYVRSDIKMIFPLS